MASFDEHCTDCKRLLGNRCEAINSWMDEMHSKFGGLHRFVRHHWRGVDEAGRLFGVLGRKAAMVHILKDCGKVPKARDWDKHKQQEASPSLILSPADGMMGVWSSTQQFDEAAKKLLERSEPCD